MRDFDFIVSPAKLLTPEIVQMVSSILAASMNIKANRNYFSKPM